MTKIEQLAAEALADDEAASPGPWIPRPVLYSKAGTAEIINERGDAVSFATSFEEGVMELRDAVFVSHARTREPLLAAYVAKVAPLIEALRVQHYTKTSDIGPWLLAMQALLDATAEPQS